MPKMAESRQGLIKRDPLRTELVYDVSRWLFRCSRNRQGADMPVRPGADYLLQHPRGPRWPHIYRRIEYHEVNPRRQRPSLYNVPVISSINRCCFRLLKIAHVVLRYRRVPPPAEFVEGDAQIRGATRVHRIVGVTAFLGKYEGKAGTEILV